MDILSYFPNGVNKKFLPSKEYIFTPYPIDPVNFCVINNKIDLLLKLKDFENPQNPLEKADLEAKYLDNTPLQWACFKGNLEIVRILQSQNLSKTMLWATCNNHSEIVEFLFDKVDDEQRKRALRWIIKHKNVSFLRDIFNMLTDYERQLVFKEAISVLEDKSITFLISQKVYYDKKIYDFLCDSNSCEDLKYLTKTNYFETTSLLIVCVKNSLAKQVEILAQIYDCNYQDELGFTALMYAALLKKGSVRSRIIEVLSSKSDLNIRNIYYENVLNILTKSN